MRPGRSPTLFNEFVLLRDIAMPCVDNRADKKDVQRREAATDVSLNAV
jgi:hypothetical protein